jgi:hypothetical protein
MSALDTLLEDYNCVERQADIHQSTKPAEDLKNGGKAIV